MTIDLKRTALAPFSLLAIAAMIMHIQPVEAQGARKQFNGKPNFAPPTESAEEDIVIDGNNTVANFNARNQEAVVNGNGCKLSIKGRCTSLVVNGSNNAIVLDQVEEIVVNGDRNKIRWASSSKLQGATDVVNNGSDNSFIANQNAPAKNK